MVSSMNLASLSTPPPSLHGPDPGYCILWLSYIYVLTIFYLYTNTFTAFCVPDFGTSPCEWSSFFGNILTSVRDIAFYCFKKKGEGNFNNQANKLLDKLVKHCYKNRFSVKK